MDSEAKKDFALVRAGGIVGGVIGFALGIVLGALICLALIADLRSDSRMWRNFRSDGLNNGSLEYTYDEEGHPIIRWKNGAELDSTTIREFERTQSENAQGVR